MEVKFYKISDDKAVLNKTLGNAAVYVCSARNSENVLAPVITVTAENLSDYNYMYIERYHRYYYIDRIETMTTGKWTFTGSVDVLMSYKEQIKALTGTVDRQENLRNGYLPDGKYKAKAYKAIVTKTFPNAMEDDSFILMTVG